MLPIFNSHQKPLFGSILLLLALLALVEEKIKINTISPNTSSVAPVKARHHIQLNEFDTSDQSNSPSSDLKTISSVECSCFNPAATKGCCERVLRRSHKMGYILTQKLFIGEERIKVTQQFRRSSPSSDFRDVILTRNWYESLISGESSSHLTCTAHHGRSIASNLTPSSLSLKGYLYHKSGRECYLDPYGNPANYSHRKFNTRWEKFLSWETNLNPPRRNRTVCEYLQDESVEDGMRVYIDVAFGQWYSRLVKNWQLANSAEDRNRTLFLCYEDLVNPRMQSKTMRQLYKWLFPGGQNSLRKWRRLEYVGGHATSHDAELRSDLKEVIKKLDATIFDNIIASMDEELGCGQGDE